MLEEPKYLSLCSQLTEELQSLRKGDPHLATYVSLLNYRDLPLAISKCTNDSALEAIGETYFLPELSQAIESLGQSDDEMLDRPRHSPTTDPAIQQTHAMIYGIGLDIMVAIGSRLCEHTQMKELQKTISVYNNAALPVVQQHLPRMKHFDATRYSEVKSSIALLSSYMVLSSTEQDCYGYECRQYVFSLSFPCPVLNIQPPR